MPHEPSRLQILQREDCIELLGGGSYVGRLGFVLEGRPIVLPVNYLLDDQSVVFCTAPGSKLSALSGGSRVAFEIDGSRPLDDSGWSVLVEGTAWEITDADELERLRRGPLRSWAVRSSEHWVRISVDEISGRRIHSL